MHDVIQPTRASRRVAQMVAAITLAVAATASSATLAHDYKLGSLKIEHPWSRATPGGAKVAGGYMKITNNGKEADRLVGGSLSAAGRLELHEMRMQGDVMQMRRLDKGLVIPPGQTVELKPGSYHVMFLDISQPFKEDTRVKGTLVFEKAGTLEVEYKVEAIGTTPGGHAHH